MRKMLALLILAAALPVSAAERTLPKDMDVALLQKVQLPQVTLGNGGFSWLKVLTLGWLDGNAAKFTVSRQVRIKDENDRYIVIGKLPAQAGKPVAVKRDAGGNIREIWILNEAETEAFKKRDVERQIAQ